MGKYDVFISCKNLDEKGNPTRDSVIAKEIYYFLKEKDLSVFFSNILLESLGISAYKIAIDDALDSAKILIVVGTKVGNLESQWVKYEWDSFCNDILSGIKNEGRLFPVIEDIEIINLPRALRQNQVFNYRKDTLVTLYNFIINALNVSEMSEKKLLSINHDEAMNRMNLKASSKGFKIKKNDNELRLSKSGTEYYYVFFETNTLKEGTLYYHVSGERVGEVYFIWCGINWFFHEKMEGEQISFLGLPISDEYVVQEKDPFISRSDFENGYIEYKDPNNELNIYKKEANSFFLINNHKF